MIKGRVQIELHNHRTGLRDRIEKENLVTNAVDKVISTLIGRGRAASTFMPLSTNLLGGVMLFEDPLTNLATNIKLPSSNTVVGFAGQVANTSSRNMGSINSIESGPVENGYMNVWDFSTSQANGTISAISLTYYGIGDGSLWKPIYSYSTLSGSDAQYSVIGRDSRYIYYISSAKIYRMLVPVNSYTVTDTNNMIGAAEDTGVTVPSGNYSNYRLDGNYIYYSNYASNTLTIYKYLASDGSLVSSFEPSKTPDPVTHQPDFATLNFSNNSFGKSNIFVRNNKVYIFNHMADYDGIFVFDGNSSGTVYCEKVYVIQDDDLAYSGNGAINYSSASNGWAKMYVTEDDTIWVTANVKDSIKGTNPIYFKQVFITEDNGAPNIKIYDEMFTSTSAELPYYRNDGINDVAYYDRYAAYCTVSGNYLGTICNLDNSIEKTATSSMKVKYTLTNV